MSIDRARKFPELTVYFWVATILSIGLGTAVADSLTTDWHLGAAFAVGLLGGAFLVALTAQFALFRYTPVVYWRTLALRGAVAHLLTENLAKVWAIPLTGLTAILAGTVPAIILLWHVTEQAV